MAVWPASGEPATRRIYELEAILTPCTAADAEPGEFDVAIEVRERISPAS